MSCDNPTQSGGCTQIAINTTIEATSYTEWVYLSVTDTGFVYLDSISESEANTSLEWDLAMMRNHFRTNSGLSGPGDGGAYMADNDWNCLNFEIFSNVPKNITFIVDSMLTNIYQPWAHEDENTAYTEKPGSTVLENWGWFDIDDSYYFYYTHKQFIVKLPENRGYIKLWPYQYYGELGKSAHITLMYDFIEESN